MSEFSRTNTTRLILIFLDTFYGHSRAQKKNVKKFKFSVYMQCFSLDFWILRNCVFDEIFFLRQSENFFFITSERHFTAMFIILCERHLFPLSMFGMTTFKAKSVY